MHMLPPLNIMQRQMLARLSVSALVASLPLVYVSLLRPPPSALRGDTAFWFLMSNCVVAAIVAADDAGTLFSGSKGNDEPCSLAAAVHDELLPPAAAAVNMDEGGALQGTVTSSNFSMDRASPFLLIQSEEDASNDAAASTPGTDASLVQRVEGEDDDVAIIEPVTEKKTTAKMVEGQRGREGIIAGPSPASTDEQLAAANAADRALDELEPWPSPVNKSNLRRQSGTEGSSPGAEEESEYNELSDDELNRRAEEFIARFEMRLKIEQEEFHEPCLAT